LTRRPGTTITLRGSPPPVRAVTFSSARATAFTSSCVAEAATVTRLRTLPLTWIGYSIVSSTRYRSSATGNGPCARDSSWPSRSHISSAACGHSGAIISTIGSTTDRGADLPLYALVTWLFSSISFAPAVLNRMFA
jgi:hypothetical protein